MPGMCVMLTEDSLMPFGTHKGKRMSDVPPSWLMWWWGSRRNSYGPLYDYIKRNPACLSDHFKKGAGSE